ncbi:hypothetical protein PRUPE_5G035000 [Prunus persica]|uniref:Uncharacterized protein n=1 Tax=Prunus persica TaxID=3760 RepID=A0A251P334_PRUPE|nr:hypothetical protein PRUPE_5G035000 [Prunus persica]
MTPSLYREKGREEKLCLCELGKVYMEEFSFTLAAVIVVIVVIFISSSLLLLSSLFDISFCSLLSFGASIGSVC